METNLKIKRERERERERLFVQFSVLQNNYLDFFFFFFPEGLKVIVDFVPNHTSNTSYWFMMSRAGTDNHYKDYYIWNSGKTAANGTKLPPNNWVPIFLFFNYLPRETNIVMTKDYNG